MRIDPRALVLSALLAAPHLAPGSVRADDAGTPPPRDPRPVCRTRVCPDWGATERERVRRREPAPPPSSTPPSSTPPSSGSGS